ncbi:MAG: L-seryl-tRNA(Ser) seleniumtransferase [Actinomycetota bacterium]|nr:L-seryl-tRNA(Ser) seleniumtransferase [Actinomycetota bacterium]
MGGPQAGVIAGRSALLRWVASHPMARALRVDKLTLATLQATLLIHLEGRAEAELPLWRMIRTTPEELKLRAHEVASALGRRVGPDVKIEVREMPSVVGGGSLPGVQLKSWGLTIAIGDMGAEELQTTLRTGSPPVIGRVEDGLLVLDLRTVLDEETGQLIESIAETLAETRR